MSRMFKEGREPTHDKEHTRWPYHIDGKGGIVPLQDLPATKAKEGTEAVAITDGVVGFLYSHGNFFPNFQNITPFYR